MPPSDVTPILRQSHERLRELVAPLDGDGLRAPSYDDDWSIAQVLSHLGSQSELFGPWWTAGLAHTDAPGPETFPPVWDRWNAKSPEEAATDSIQAAEDLLTTIEATSAAELAAFRLDLFGLDLDADGLLRMRLSEHAVHTWDVEVALHPAATIAAGALPELLEVIPGLVGRAARDIGREVAVAVTTIDPDRTFVLEFAGEQASLRDAAEGDAPVASLRLPAEAFIRLLYGRLDPDHTPPSVEAEGVTLDELRAAFPGV